MTNRNDTIELILDHAIEQGSYSQNYMDRLSAMNDSELNIELERIDTIELILDHAIEQGSYSQNYMDRLSAMNDSELNIELERIEEIAVYGFTDVGGMTYDEVRFSSRGD